MILHPIAAFFLGMSAAFGIVTFIIFSVQSSPQRRRKRRLNNMTLVLDFSRCQTAEDVEKVFEKAEPKVKAIKAAHRRAFPEMYPKQEESNAEVSRPGEGRRQRHPRRQR